ncbi:hypothetical protein A5906_30530 [Bradyrhizobium sacchari]|uniref:hypothetical protein n=1 Tax=Bradyrhizobium sacchari TaxID=1399419 RepID=UPI0009AFD052|nr:hypothetical protein [Bradyrhizobium sacchari]OPY98898.1 hypothetical protein A5906_30530 [Bradyrhizobium sacchari]
MPSTVNTAAQFLSARPDPHTTTGNVTAASSVPNATAPDTGVHQPLILDRKNVGVGAGRHQREQHDHAGG